MIQTHPNPTSSVDNQRKSLQISFNDVVYSVSGPKKGPQIDILKFISGDFRPGDLTAIIGGSGAGKSTLMNILAGFKSRFQGNILINGVPRNLNEFRKMSCYIMQKDELCPYLTVIEAMELAASLKLGNQLSSHVKLSLIDEILETISMSHAKETITSKLSGGERKRLSIALEMIKNPPILFLDEPTSGLDSSTCFQVISLLRTLASGGRNIICVIHQPSSSIFAMFDRVYLLADGHCIYSGPTNSMVRYLSKSVDLVCPNDHNPADFAIEVAMGRFGNLTDQLVEANQRRIDSGDNDDERNPIQPLNNATANYGIHNDVVSTQCNIQDNPDTISTPAVSSGISGSPRLDNEYSNLNSADVFNAKGAQFFTQYKLLFKRSIQCTLRDLILTRIRLVAQISIALALIVFYLGIGNEASQVEENVGLLFLNQIIIEYTAMMTTILIFPLERAVLIKEHLNNWYTLKAYFLAKSTADIPFEIGHTTVYVVIVYFSTGQPLEVWRFFMYYVISLMNSLVAQSLGLAFGILFPVETAAVMGPLSGMFCVLFATFFCLMSNAPVYLRWMYYSSNLKYAFQGSVAVIYGFGREKLPCSQPFCSFRSPSSVLEAYEVEESDFLVGLCVLIAYFVFVRFLAYLFLRRDMHRIKHR